MASVKNITVYGEEFTVAVGNIFSSNDELRAMVCVRDGGEEGNININYEEWEKCKDATLGILELGQMSKENPRITQIPIDNIDFSEASGDGTLAVFYIYANYGH